MHSLTLLLLFIPLTLTSPTPNPTYSKTLRTLHADLHARQLCDALPTPGQNCAGASLKDVIVTYPTTLPETDAVLMRGVVENAGGRMLYDWKSHGFSAYIPDQVVSLMQKHGEGLGVRVHENACAEIPWCGEAPC